MSDKRTTEEIEAELEAIRQILALGEEQVKRGEVTEAPVVMARIRLTRKDS